MNSAANKIRVAVVYGGQSSEHSVSCVSAGAVMSHLDPERFEVYPIGISKEGAWTVGTTDVEELRTQDRVMPTVKMREPLTLALDPAHRGEFRFEDGSLHTTVDVIFPVLHGPYGEDGTIQGLFDLSGVPYVGTGVLSSACGMDKEFTKKLLKAEGLPVGEEVVLRDGRDLSEQELARLGLPVFVKPARGGSSIGISRVESRDELAAAIELARQYDSKVIVEAEIVGEEVECGVLEYADGTRVASVPARLINTDGSDEGFYGFDTKYLDNVVSAEIPAQFDEALLAQLRELSLRAFDALNCEGLARVDFFVSDNGPVLNEINTMPGFTPISMYPKVFEASGVTYPQLLSALIDQALSSAA
ncbi:D-alanine--D-alanine ligase family protein [Corynebacterium pseudopelargi]|uniref:D-alanine--D-alanine ligase family protein n=1 Tax=Corynebacterium pseudopelargi TaxID=2080757 RepID=UPI000F4DC9F4|nr:D-alanine--D-alanine ligase family protein [Corynebacterium pseudopelargi]